MKKLVKIISLILASFMVIIASSFNVEADSNQRWNLGSAVKTDKDKGYTGEKPINLDDPHYGWALGQFYVSGYTQRTTDSQTDVFLKNVGDQVELHFELLQDIDCLNGNSNLSICRDKNGYDQYFGTQQFNDIRGLLIIRKTDYQNTSSDPVIYTNYLDGVAQGADTVVEFCEEGDYEVALDYEIKEEHYGVGWNTYVSVPTYTNYRIFFTFKIRNGNCMVFPFDTNGSELANESFTENGFYLDLANSRYLDINVQRSIFVEGANGYTEDIRFNRPASDGTKYTDEGIYTITVRNNYTNQETIKKIYVGTDPTMKAFVVSGYTLEEIKAMLDEGYTISDSGNMIPPEPVEEEIELEVEDTVEEEPAVQIDDEKPEQTVSEPIEESASTDKPKKGKGGVVVLIIGLVIAVIVFVLLKSKKPKFSVEKSDSDNTLSERDNSGDTPIADDAGDVGPDNTENNNDVMIDGTIESDKEQ